MAEEQFDLNDPKLYEYVPEGENDADMVAPTFGPPEDGVYRVSFRLRPATERLPKNPYIKVKDGTPGLVAVLGGYIQTLDGQGRGYIKDYYLQSKKSQFQPVSSMAFLIKEGTGKALPNGAPLSVIEKVLVAMFDAAGDESITAHAYLQWVRTLKIDDKWVDVKGRGKVSAYNIDEITKNVNSDPELSAEDRAAYIDKVTKAPYLYYEYQPDGSTKELMARVMVKELQIKP